MSFNKDLKIGQSVEVEVGNILASRGFKVVYNNSNTREDLKRYDLIASKDGIDKKIEVKYDILASSTGNIALEVRCIIESNADFFVYKFNNEYWYTTRQNLFKEISKQGRFVTGGDNGNSYMKLIKIEEFKQYSKQLK